jgi:hypothetical protein
LKRIAGSGCRFTTPTVFELGFSAFVVGIEFTMMEENPTFDFGSQV